MKEKRTLSMKKIVAILMALAVLFSFAMAEVTPTNLSSTQKQTATATAAPTAEPAAAAEPAVVNFREALTADQLAAGTYVQVLELPLQYWVANDVFTNEEVPAEEGYEETIAILAFIANPEEKIVIDCGETELDFDTFYGNLTAEDMKDYFSDVTRATVNGMDCAAYLCLNEDGTKTRTVEYFSENTFVKFAWPETEDDDFDNFATMTATSLEAIQ